MNYLGGLRGTGLLLRGQEAIAQAQYDFDGYLTHAGEVISSGEIRLSTATLRDLFGRGDLHLQTPDGRLLDLRFSDKRLSREDGAAHVDVNGDLPAAPDWAERLAWLATSSASASSFRASPRSRRRS